MDRDVFSTSEGSLSTESQVDVKTVFDFTASQEKEPYRASRTLRFVTASSLFDGHDASINIMRRILQSSGAEVIHLGHNRSVQEIVTTAIQEDADGIAISSYQGGHMEFFKYMYDLLREQGAGHIRIFGGGGGVIVAEEMEELESYGIARVFSPADGQKMGLQGMINEMLRQCDRPKDLGIEELIADLRVSEPRAIAKVITFAEAKHELPVAHYGDVMAAVKERAGFVPVVGITGTGGAGKSSLTDELVRRFLFDFPDMSIAILSVDPSRQKTGGALLGDRIRMNSIYSPHVYMRSLATRQSHSELSAAIQEAMDVVRAAGFDLILVETSGIGQGNAQVAEIADIAVYVMTAEFGAPSQLEKIDMLDYADLIVVNKFDRRGAEDALHHVQKQVQRNRNAFSSRPEEMPVYGTVASQFNDSGTNRFYQALVQAIRDKMAAFPESHESAGDIQKSVTGIIPGDRVQYLQEIVQTVRAYHQRVQHQEDLARQAFQLWGALATLNKTQPMPDTSASFQDTPTTVLQKLYDQTWNQMDHDAKLILDEWQRKRARYEGEEFVTRVRNQEIRQPLFTVSLSGTRIPRVILPNFQDWGEIVRWSMEENVPGEFPFTAGVFSLRRADEEPRRQFAGEGTPERTNRRFHYLSKNDPAKRLSTAFDSVTLYGEDPDERPDIYGKIGESGVSICTLEDMEKLYGGFDLCDPNTSVSMTINGPAPEILAMYMNTAIRQQVRRFVEQTGHSPDSNEYTQLQEQTLFKVRGTVQADILKEDQGQNTCIFSTEFALRMMGDIQQYFIEHHVRNYYSVSISGYHIAEAGANPLTQLAFTLANAFTYVEYYLSRGMKVDDFAQNLSFFFSNGMDPEYTVIGRVARRIWSVVMKYKYGANERSQKLKYHIQTSGRSLHAQEIDFNDIRTTLQALIALNDNCNSLHTNAYDEAITTPTEESVRRAMAIQMIINREFGLTKNENSLQGSFIMEKLTDWVEEAVLAEFLRLNDRGGVLGAMELQYQRGKIQEESMYYEQLKHSGQLPIIGVNTFINPMTLEPGYVPQKIELARANKTEKDAQIENLRAFQEQHAQEVGPALERLQQVAKSGGNLFAELMETVQVASLGQITQALYEVGGRYRRNM
ncbi:methylmalonyl-CoA mutase [Alicyclobacillaceae bacterium I2511]|nr:methylmalonyl-CoA mutase [Alicyclobacillaceae bacterium I2511]